MVPNMPIFNHEISLEKFSQKRFQNDENLESSRKFQQNPFRIAIFRRMLQPPVVVRFLRFKVRCEQSEESGKKTIKFQQKGHFRDSHLWEDVVTSVVVRFLRFKLRCKDLRKIFEMV
ncbi:hypothetical protein Adt_41143 [Abeliophyllum distichum]|uniref:Ribosomal protein S10 n=1 Tax=Abeliophyllum distichum TaxID=126358 RepID=A0ABD1PNT8_9LAMI